MEIYSGNGNVVVLVGIYIYGKPDLTISIGNHPHFLIRIITLTAPVPTNEIALDTTMATPPLNDINTKSALMLSTTTRRRIFDRSRCLTALFLTVLLLPSPSALFDVMEKLGTRS
jgi:hypothetical protein